jgi:ribonucleotide reductase beta subunit family protein with ferritin-like domain
MTSTLSSKYTLFPIQYHKLFELAKKHAATFWVAEEVPIYEDIPVWNALKENERYFIKNILAFFAASDGIVNENLVVNFYNEIEIPEVRYFYTIQMAIESIHSEQYSLLIDTYVPDEIEKEKLFRAIETIPAVNKKAQWAIKWIESAKKPNQQLQLHSEELQLLLPQCSEELKGVLTNLCGLDKQEYDMDFSTRLLAFICVEGIFFSGSFCAIYWLKDRGLMKGLATSNEFISRDENLHAEFAIELYKTICKRLPESSVHQIFTEAVDIEKEFISESLPVSLIGMNCKLMCEYIEYVADRWLIFLGYNKIYNTKNPFEFMNKMALSSKTNFFENKVTEYNKSGTHETNAIKNYIDEDF